MLRTLEAVIDEQGYVRLLEPVHLPAGWRVLVTILDEPIVDVCETALLSEQALAEDWSRPEEDEAWSHLQQVSLS
jgi:predicted DNA-binding antitoxin AbrB/MazE fold protein